MKSGFVKFVGATGLVMFPCFAQAQADVFADIKRTFETIATGVSTAEADVCNFFDQHDTIFRFAYKELVALEPDVAKQVKVYVETFCQQADVKAAVN